MNSAAPAAAPAEPVELTALENLVVAAAVNKRLLMRILAHLEHRDLADLHEEVAALDREFRGTVHDGMAEAAPAREEPVEEGALPMGREEERRGHALPNTEATPGGAQGPAIGKDRHARKHT